MKKNLIRSIISFIFLFSIENLSSQEPPSGYKDSLIHQILIHSFELNESLYAPRYFLNWEFESSHLDWEELYSIEPNTNFKNKQTNYEFVTQIGNDFYLHINRKKYGPFIGKPYKLEENIYMVLDKNIPKGHNRVVYYFLPNSEKLFGPYDCTYKGFEYTQEGFTFLKNNFVYIKQFNGLPDLGPFLSVEFLRIKGEGLSFAYEDSTGWYIQKNSIITGPFTEFRSLTYDLFVYKSNLGYFYENDGKTFGPYSAKPSYNYEINPENWRMYISEPNGIYTGYYIMPNGSKVEAFDCCSKNFYLTDGRWIKLDRTKNERYGFIYYSNGRKSEPYSLDGFDMSRLNGNNFATLVSDTVQINPISGQVIYNENRKRYIIHNEKKIGPVTSDDYWLGKSKLAYKANKELFVDEAPTGIKKFEEFSFEENSDDWTTYTYSKNRDTINIFKNGGLISFIVGTPNKFGRPKVIYSNQQDYWITYLKEGEGYIRSIHLSKDIGPYIIKGFRPVFSKNYKHIAFSCDNRDIIVDGKMMGEGFGLTYDETHNMFCWISKDKKGVYLNKYKL